MLRKKLLESALAFAAMAIVLMLLIHRFEASLLDAMLPLLRAELHWLLPAFRLDGVDWKIARGETVFTLRATLIEYRVILGQVVPPGGSVEVSTLAARAWVHPVLLCSLLMAWPGMRWRRKAWLLPLGLPCILLAEMGDVPLMLWGGLEDILYWQIDPARTGASWGSFIQHALDGGGRYLLSIGLAVLAVSLCKTLRP